MQENDTCKSLFGIIRMMFKDFLVCVIIQLHVIFDFLVDLLFGFYYNGRTKKIPSIKNDLLLMSASELAERIRYLLLFIFLYPYFIILSRIAFI